ncbi:MAG: phosphatase PAP2 family protein, partial [Chloroflexota bacterium]
ANAPAGSANAVRVMDFERAHGFWVEPGIQHFFLSTHHILGVPIGWPLIRPIADGLYDGHELIALAFTLWVYFWRRDRFALIRNVFVLTNLLGVLLYETFPLAPPRLATGLSYQGRPYHFLDTVFQGGGGVRLSFNEYAAMPSFHIAWALIVSAALVWMARSLLVRLLAPLYPAIMLIVVIVTGNHYIADALGAVAVVSVAALVSTLIPPRHAGSAPLVREQSQGLNERAEEMRENGRHGVA